MRAAALKVHPIALDNLDSGCWRERSAASRGTAEAAFRALGKVSVDVPFGASDEEKKKAFIGKKNKPPMVAFWVSFVSWAMS